MLWFSAWYEELPPKEKQGVLPRLELGQTVDPGV